MSPSKKYAIAAGLLIALAGSLLMFLLLGLGFVGPESVRNDRFMLGGTILFIALYVFLLFGIYISITKAKKSDEGSLTFRKAFAQGVVTSAAAAVFAVVFTILFYEVLYPQFTADVIAVLNEKLSRQNLTPPEIQQKVQEQTRYYSTGMQAQFTFVGNLITGIAFTLILSLFLKSKT